MRRPWNYPALPVYSVCTEGNMNICTYFTAVSMKPKRFMIAVYKNTKTLDNVQKDKRVLVQLLCETQSKHVRRLGMRSGKDGYKLNRLPLKEYKGLPYLDGALAIMELSIVSMHDEGDHWCCFADLVSYKSLCDGDVLTTTHLRDRGIIR